MEAFILQRVTGNVPPGQCSRACTKGGLDRCPVTLVRSEATLALPMGELAAPWGQTERVRRHNYPLPTLNRGTLSVSLFG